ncbi:MAG: FAD-dependent oxidoreductase [Desulfarculaceae bacterium]|nr:FAD-dependent oxidoreductase [Desulfarculaceae bacterium]MCF8071492.1 FAD-dependent oxidoreductase [Desulfarculaceae bacterium]MCF8102307.1 FAD-dependent oxidoreductase [Desulfarculaceae bacterium]MCF8114771.1 FAD-dependent oxidoreductase [Desulfarculaceae bacterium]
MPDSLMHTWRQPAGGGLAAEALEKAQSQGPVRAVMSSEGVLVLDPAVDPVDLARAYVELARDMSCGQCFPCRLGTQQLAKIMERICAGQGSREDLSRLESLANQISDTARCDIGRTLARPINDILAAHRGLFKQTVDSGRKVEPGSYQSLVTAPCINACPSHVDVPGYLEGIRLGRYDQAMAKVRNDCPMPGTIGRVCVRPCEANCRRNQLDQPLAIRWLKRFLADQEMSGAIAPPEPPAEFKEPKVAVVGAGPAGLSCAYYLGRQGFHTTVFEAQEGPGGMAAYGIPSYRLPREVLAFEAQQVERTGAEIRYGVRVGEDVSLKELGDQGYSAVFIGVGAPEASSMRCEGEDAGYQCFMTGVEFLAQASRGQQPLEGKKMLVIGGGNVAMDCVRTARRLGFDQVNLLYRRTEAEMPADPAEIREAKEEGVHFHYLVAPQKVLAADGKVTGLECLKMELGEPDDSGRRRPVPVQGSEFVLECDAIIPAVGQICVVDCVLPDAGGVTPWKTLVVDQDTFQSDDPTVFGGGDCVTGPATLIGALAAGKKAAGFLATHLQGGECRPGPQHLLESLVQALGVYDPEEAFAYPGLTEKAEPPTLDPEVRVQSFAEVEGGATPPQARVEASRCLRCYRLAVAALDPASPRS